jgi:SAM-dependent methyltransferase
VSQPLASAAKRVCPFCDSPDVAEHFTALELVVGTREGYDYSVCASCAAIYLTDATLNVKALYPEDHYAFGDLQRAAVAGFSDRITSLIDAVRWTGILRKDGVRLDKSTRFADVGCGDPRLLRALRSIGYTELTGIDPYLPARSRADGISLLRMQIEEVAARPEYRGAFDVVMFHHSLEHVADPAASLRAAATVLAQDGVLFVRLPVVNVAWERYRAAWHGMVAPQHLSIPSEKSMAILAQRCGFAVSRVVYDSTRLMFVISEAHANGLSRDEAFPPGPLKKVALTLSTMHLWLRARRLNAQGRGDQAAFVLKPLAAQLVTG